MIPVQTFATDRIVLVAVPFRIHDFTDDYRPAAKGFPFAAYEVRHTGFSTTAFTECPFPPDVHIC